MVMLAAGAAAALAIGLAYAETTTSKSGSSSATITQDPATDMKRKVVKTPDGQKIIQKSGAGSVSISQSSGGGASKDDDKMDDMDCPDKEGAKDKAKSKDADDDC
jgi:hypothetical protein